VVRSFLSRILSEGDRDLRRRLIFVYGGLIGMNVLVWLWALVALRDHPVLLGSAVLAYTFGLRHAVDADHIAAIDNATRKLMQQGERPVALGLFFSLGHSTVVILMSIAVGLASTALTSRFDSLKQIGGVIGTSVSASFLLLLAIFNLVVFVSIYRTFRAVRRGEPFVEDYFDILLNSRGFLARLFRRMFRLVTKSWHLYPIGFLFGLGFDTATEVALLGMSATQAAEGLPFATLLVFPALFTACMTLLDTTDGILMLGAYGWAFMKPIRKLYYNLTITAVSVIVALLIGSIEALGLIGSKLGLEGPFWEVVGALNENFGFLGYVIVGVFVLSWLVSILIYRFSSYDDLQARSTNGGRSQMITCRSIDTTNGV
jgi:nickel/cobalt transporter (NiCoT) family protein